MLCPPRHDDPMGRRWQADALTGAGFTIVRNCDEYSDRPCSAGTTRAIWVARRQ
jgi:hypothetical protein